MSDPKSWLDTMLESEAVQKKLAEVKKSLDRGNSPDLIFDFDHVMGAIGIVEAAITETQGAVHDWSTKRAMAAAANPQTNFIEEGIFTGMAAPMWNAHWTLPMILRRSLFLTVSTHTEHVLRQWCRSLQERWSIQQPLGRKPRDKTDLQHCMEYLRDAIGLGVGGFEKWPEWLVLDTNRIIRNCLAHDGGLVPNEHLERLKAVTYIQVEDDPVLVGDEAFVNVIPGACEYSATITKAFFERLSSACDADPRTKQP